MSGFLIVLDHIVQVCFRRSSSTFRALSAATAPERLKERRRFLPEAAPPSLFRREMRDLSSKQEKQKKKKVLGEGKYICTNDGDDDDDK